VNPRTREIWRIDRAGSLGRLKRQADTLPPPGPGEARVRIQAVGLNLADVFACLGLYSATPKGPFVPGLEFAGVIEELGPPDDERGGATAASFGPGDAVFGMTRFGAYATAINAHVRLLGRIPRGWSAAEGAALPVQGLTAWYGLVELARVEQGRCSPSAAGGVGPRARHPPLCCARAGHRGREEKRRFLIEARGLSPDQVIVRDRRRFGDQLDRALAAMGVRGLDVVFDAVAGPFLEPAFRRLRPGGRLVVFGAADFMPRGRSRLDPRLLVKYVRRWRMVPHR
jgi:alcohol dehydrogenase